MKKYIIVVSEGKGIDKTESELFSDCYGSFYKIVPVEVRKQNLRIEKWSEGAGRPVFEKEHIVQFFYDLDAKQKIQIKKTKINEAENFLLPNGTRILADTTNNKLIARCYNSKQEAEKAIKTQIGFSSAVYQNYN